MRHVRSTSNDAVPWIFPLHPSPPPFLAQFSLQGLLPCLNARQPPLACARPSKDTTCAPKPRPLKSPPPPRLFGVKIAYKIRFVGIEQRRGRREQRYRGWQRDAGEGGGDGVRGRLRRARRGAGAGGDAGTGVRRRVRGWGSRREGQAAPAVQPEPTLLVHAAARRLRWRWRRRRRGG